MTSKKVVNLIGDNFDTQVDFVTSLVQEQRLNHNKNIEKVHKEHKKHLHIAEYKLIVGLLKGLQSSLSLEYLHYLNSNDSDNYILFDVWAIDKLVTIYSKAV